MVGRHWFNRYLLPGLAFKAVVIGGGYATGREMVTFFLPSGPVGGLLAALLATLVWSLICALTFVFAVDVRARDYRTFFGELLGPAWRLYELCWIIALIVILAAFGAAAGAIGKAVLGWPELAGALLLMAAIGTVAAFGNDAVERVFKYVSLLLYGTYATFVVLAFTHFGDRIEAAFAGATPGPGWVSGGLTYAGYNVIGAIVILPVTRHLLSRRDAVISGLIAGPLAMIPAVLFFICMCAYAPDIARETLPSDFLLGKLDMPVFRLIFQLMIFGALLESGTGGVHAINERVAHSYRARRGREPSRRLTTLATMLLLTIAAFLAGEFGLVAIVANGYRWLAYAFLLIYVLPLLTIGVYRIATRRRGAGPALQAAA